MAPLELKPFHGNDTPIADASKPFSITASPNTDAWRPDHSTDTFTAPVFTTDVDLSTFKSVSATVSAKWKTLYDQGGLIFLFPQSNGPTRWIKMGIEVYKGKPALSVVGTDRCSDWSLAPLIDSDGGSATFLAEKEGTTLWVYAVRGAEKQPLREVKWALLDVDDAPSSMNIGVYAAKPTPDEDDAKGKVEVFFKDFKLETS